jgi:hypothetical protein
MGTVSYQMDLRVGPGSPPAIDARYARPRPGARLHSPAHLPRGLSRSHIICLRPGQSRPMSVPSYERSSERRKTKAKVIEAVFDQPSPLVVVVHRRRRPRRRRQDPVVVSPSTRPTEGHITSQSGRSSALFPILAASTQTTYPSKMDRTPNYTCKPRSSPSACPTLKLTLCSSLFLLFLFLPPSLPTHHKAPPPPSSQAATSSQARQTSSRER